MAEIRVFLLTCRRPQLLPRALASLRAQTFTDWICELHNDAPEDSSPGRLLESLADPRITLRQHAQNWGPVASFNHAFAGGPEPFAALLEDDNWWDPSFLVVTHAALKATPEASVVWSNMRLWQEQRDGGWTDTGRTVWNVPADCATRLFRWPEPIQCTDALHSNGAMLYRARSSAAALVPPSTPFAIIEPVRERLMSGAWLFIPQVLAHFSLTLSSVRSRDRLHWAQAQLLVAGTYLASVPDDSATLASIWRQLRSQRPPSTPLLFQVALSGIRSHDLLRHARPSDWVRFIAGAIRHPLNLLRALRFREDHRAVWTEVLAAARRRTAESVAHPDQENPFLRIVSKNLQ